MAMMPPPPQRTPPELLDDLLRDIFMRLPPDDPRALVGAAYLCRSWRAVLSNAAFAKDYLKRHGAPPLGFFYEELIPDTPVHEIYWVSHFVPTTATFRPLACRDRPYWHVLDSRHGLVLFYTPRMEADFVVCDLFSGKEWEIHADTKFNDIMRWEDEEEDEKLERSRCNAAVFCATNQCDHLNCYVGPFRIALVGSDEGGSRVRATFYSSDTRQWSAMVEVRTPHFIEGTGLGHNALVGNKVYVPCVESDSVIEYNMDDQRLRVINPPDTENIYSLMGVKDGMLLFASLESPILNLWSMDVGPSGAVEWAGHRIIDLEHVLPQDDEFDFLTLSGFVEVAGASVIFLSTADGVYSVDLNSVQCKKVHDRLTRKVLPCMSFSNGAWWLPTSR